MFKSWFCKHEWEFVGKDKRYKLGGTGYSTINVMYCPKCNTEGSCTDMRMEIELNKMKARKEWELNNIKARREWEE